MGSTWTTGRILVLPGPQDKAWLLSGLVCSVLFSSVQFSSVLFCSVLFTSILFCSVLFWSSGKGCMELPEWIVAALALLRDSKLHCCLTPSLLNANLSKPFPATSRCLMQALQCCLHPMSSKMFAARHCREQ